MKCVDLFAGWGGFSLGAELAGATVVWAANHWRLAVDAHQHNHPATQHVCQDLRQADWTALPVYDVLLASPCCQGHSRASQPRRRLYHDAMRATAWAVVDCADQTSPRAILTENVPSFREWRLYPVWRDALVALGYRVQEHIVRASHCGVAQRRDRLFVLATRRPLKLDLPSGAEPPFAPLVEWSEGKWRAVAEAAPGAQTRIRTAQAKSGRRCLVQHVTGHAGVPLDEPIRTITTKDQWAIVDGDRYRPLTLREYARGMGFPDHYGWPATTSRADAVRGLGNAVCPPVAATLVRQLAA